MSQPSRWDVLRFRLAFRWVAIRDYWWPARLACLFLGRHGDWTYYDGPWCLRCGAGPDEWTADDLRRVRDAREGTQG